MNKTIIKLISAIISILLITTLCSCSDEKSEFSAGNSKKSLIVEVDGKNITIEDAEGKTIEQLLMDAKITLNDGDVLSIDTDVKFADNMVVKILRQAEVTIEDTIKGIEYKVVLTGATVSDALTAAGIKLSDNLTTNYKSNEALKDGMDIVISIKKEPETTEPYSEDVEEDDNYTNYYDDNSDSGYTPPVTKPATTKPVPTTQPPVTKVPTTKAPVPTTSGRTIVSVEIYEDCDGSGHGVKVITYSDGTQEEVPF